MPISHKILQVEGVVYKWQKKEEGVVYNTRSHRENWTIGDDFFGHIIWMEKT